MRKLKSREIDQYLNYIDSMEMYKAEKLSTWDNYESLYGLFILKSELIALLTIYRDVGIEISDFKLPSINFEDEDYIEGVGLINDFSLNEMGELIHELVFPNIDIEKKGWSEYDILEIGDVLEFYEKDVIDQLYSYNENEKEDAYQRIINDLLLDEDKNILNLNEFIDYVAMEDYRPNVATIIKSERAGKYLDYAEKNPEIKEKKLHKHILMCVERIISPFHCSYAFEDYRLHNGCIYAFYTAGYFESTGEYIGYAHCRFARYLCFEILDQLLEKAEKMYKYNKSNSQ